MFQESTKRSVAKTISWRVLILVTDFSLAFLITGQAEIASGFALIKFVLGFVLYFAHERAWNFVSWEKK